MNTNGIGVIVARFQVPQLHAGHRHLIEYVQGRHEQVLIVLGTTPTRLTERNPLDYATRAAMVARAYPQARIVSLGDMRTDDWWSNALDALIEQEFPGQSAILYGSRQSCLDQYIGRYPCQLVPCWTSISATGIRKRVVRPLNTSAFRRGVIYAAQQKYPTAYQVVDVAVLSHDRKSVLLGTKHQAADRWHFLGGFVDPNDQSLELAAKREVMEETSMIETDDYHYLGSARIDDWRYPVGGKDSMMSAFFAARYVFGAPWPADDITQLAWRPIDELEQALVPEHQALGKMLRRYLATKGGERSDDHDSQS